MLNWYLTGLCFYVYLYWRIAPPGFNLVIILWLSTTVFLTRGNDLWAYDIGPVNMIFRFPDHKYWPRRGHMNRHGPNQVLFQFVTGEQIVWHVRSWTWKAIGNVSHCGEGSLSALGNNEANTQEQNQDRELKRDDTMSSLEFVKSSCE